jgi:hypothetical protein
MGFPNQAAAQQAAEATKATLSEAWKIRVWENLNWYASVRLGPLEVHLEPWNDDFIALLSDDVDSPCGGAMAWTVTRTEPFTTARDAAVAEIQAFLTYRAQLDRVQAVLAGEFPELFYPSVEAAPLFQLAKSLQIGPSDLDDLVHDMVSCDGATINNGGLPVQIPFLIEQMGADALTQALEGMKG